MVHPYIHVQPEVQAALRAKRPVVALESTLITHGFPRPDNLRIAKTIEQVVRDHQAIPATIAILSGKVKVGLTEEELVYLAKADDVWKCSTRDLPLVVTQKKDGATTVASTIQIAHQAGIAVFATGGIGGVHRGALADISADLTELGRTPITVVCAGMKAFLDLAGTLEYLETQAVPVLGYGTSELPAFYSRNSGLAIDLRVDNAYDVAEVVRARNALKLGSAVLLTVPVPEADEWPAEQANLVIQQALAEIETLALPGKEITPYLLDRIATLSGYQSKKANESLLINNARVGAEVARELCRQTQQVYV